MEKLAGIGGSNAGHFGKRNALNIGDCLSNESDVCWFVSLSSEWYRREIRAIGFNHHLFKGDFFNGCGKRFPKSNDARN